jgi:hypothetical protein
MLGCAAGEWPGDLLDSADFGSNLMQDRYAIMNTGFKNLVDGGSITGYQVNIREPYYRGTFLSSVHYLDLAVDGAKVPREDIKIMVSGKTFTLDQMEEADDVRWGFGDAATLLVRKAGGLSPGIHEIRLGITIRKSYLPATDPEHLYSDFPGLWRDGKYSTYIEAPSFITKRMTLVQ